MIRLIDLFPIELDRMNIQTIEVSGWAGALCGMRNPMDSWAKSDSYYDDDRNIVIGENDMKLVKSLTSSGPEHAKFLRMIHVQMNVNMPRYWWSEADTYHFNTKNSQSTMHKLLNRNTPITRELFITCEEDEDIVDVLVGRLESLRIAYKDIQKNATGSVKSEKLNHLLLRAKRILAEGFYQMRTMDTTYAEIRTMYFQRRPHRLTEEWLNTFCNWVESLPYAEPLITGE